MRGKRKSRQEDMDLGLAILSCLAIPGVPLTQQDIAAFAGCTRQRIEQIENGALRKLRIRLKFLAADKGELYSQLMDEMFNRRSPAVARPKLRY